MVYAWNMKGVKPSFAPHRELTTLELPKGTVLEIELVYEITGKVRTEISCIMFILQISIAMTISCKIIGSSMDHSQHSHLFCGKGS